jgi:hypothetical protein
LAEHRSVHTALKPFVCKFCGKSSRLKGKSERWGPGVISPLGSTLSRISPALIHRRSFLRRRLNAPLL